MAGAGRRLRELDKLVAKLDRRSEQLTTQLLATTDHVELRRLGNELAVVAAEKSTAEDEWLEVAEASESS
jgi:ATP-binding cassette subfamily F protein uup